MTTPGLSPRDRRVLASGALAVIAIAVMGRGVPAARAWNAARVDSAASLAGELSFGRLAHQRLALARASLAAALQRSAEIDSGILVAPSPSASAALLASLVADAADSSHVRIIATQLRSDSVRAASLALISVRITAVCDVTGLLALMRTIENADALLAIEELAISQSDPAAPDEKPEMLRAEIVVAALSRAPISKL